MTRRSGAGVGPGHDTGGLGRRHGARAGRRVLGRVRARGKGTGRFADG